MSSLSGTVAAARGDLGSGAGDGSDEGLGFLPGALFRLGRFAGVGATALGVTSTTGAAAAPDPAGPPVAEAVAASAGLGVARNTEGTVIEDELVRRVGTFGARPRSSITIAKPTPAETKSPKIASTQSRGGPCLLARGRGRCGSGGTGAGDVGGTAATET